jgi:hypothetical protein
MILASISRREIPKFLNLFLDIHTGRSTLSCMKLNDAIKEAKQYAKSNHLDMIVVDEGPHADDHETEFPCYGYCPADSKELLYRYGTVVKTIKAK